MFVSFFFRAFALLRSRATAVSRDTNSTLTVVKNSLAETKTVLVERAGEIFPHDFGFAEEARIRKV